MKSIYLLFEQQYEAFSETTAALFEAMKIQAWLNGTNSDVWFRAVMTDDPTDPIFETYVKQGGLRNVVPIGGVDFTNAFLRKFTGRDVKALNVPPELNTLDFTGRSIWPSLRKDEVAALAAEGTPLLLKPERTPKLFEATPYSPSALEELPDEEPLFVSELLSRDEIVSEWRMFVERGKLVDIRPYILDKWVFPDRVTTDRMCEAMARYPAVTIDVGVLKSGETIVLEAHNFLACGLYGFGGPEALRMTKAAWRWEISEKK